MDSQSQNIVYRKLLDLHPHPLNPRGKIDPRSPEIVELAESIKSVGLLSPLLITPKNVVLCGHRRWHACELAGFDPVPVVVQDVSHSEQLVIMLIENMQRKELSTIQTARGYKALKDSGLSIKEIAAKVGYSAMSVSKHLDVLRLPQEIQEMVESSTLPLGGVQPLLEIKKKPEQIRIAKLAVENNWLINEITSACNKSPHNFRAAIVPKDSHPVPIDEVRELGLKTIDRFYFWKSDLSRHPEFKNICQLLTAGELLLADILDERKKATHLKSAS